MYIQNKCLIEMNLIEINVFLNSYTICFIYMIKNAVIFVYIITN